MYKRAPQPRPLIHKEAERALTHEEVTEWLRFDEQQGLFYWRKHGVAKRAGAIAGTRAKCKRVVIQINMKMVFAHRLAWFYVHKTWPTEQIDHINCDENDNRLMNLRPASPADNQANRRRQKNNTSGYKGVSYHKGDRKWRATITRHGKQKHLGNFDHAELAYEAYCQAAVETFGEFARL